MRCLVVLALFYSTSLTTAGPVLETTPAHETLDLGECIADECKPRLSSHVEVHSYELEYRYNSTNDTVVQGHVTIDFTLREPIDQLIYHAKRMVELHDVVLYEDGVHRLVTMRTYPPNDYISLRLVEQNASFAPNRYRIKQKFAVSLIDGNVGFYQGIYNDGNGTVGYSERWWRREVSIGSRCSLFADDCWPRSFNPPMLARRFLASTSQN